MATARIDIGADTADYVAKVKQIPGITEKEADKAGKAFRNKLINQAVKGLGEVGDAAEDAVKKTGQATDKLGGQLLDLGEIAGVPGDKIKKLGAGIGALTNPAGIAAIAVGAIAIAAAGTVTGIVAAVDAADDLARSLGEIRGLSRQEGFGVTKSELKTIDEANAAMDALSVIGQQAVVTLGSELAPAVKAASIELVKFGLIGLDAFNAFADGGNLLSDLADFLAGRFLKAVTKPIDKLADFAFVLAKVAKAAGADGLAKDLMAVERAYEGVVDGFSAAVVDGVSFGFERLSESTAEYDKRAQELVGTIFDQNAAERNAADAAKAKAEADRDAAKAAREAEQAEKDRIRALEDLVSQYQRVRDAEQDASRGAVARAEREIATIDSLEAQLAASGELTAEREQTLASRRAQIAAEYVTKVLAEDKRIQEQRARDAEADIARDKATQEARVSASANATNQILSGVDALAQYEYQTRTSNARQIEDQLADTESELTDSQRKELETRLALEKKQAKRSFNLSKALSIAQIAISTAEASMAAFAQGMKIGGPIGAAALVAATLAVGGLQTALVAKQKLPTAHRGQVPLDGAAADERLTLVTDEEGVLTQQGVRSVGGPAGVAALNAGQSAGMGGSVMVNLNLNNRTMQTVVAEASRGPGPARNAMRRDNPVGQRRRR